MHKLGGNIHNAVMSTDFHDEKNQKSSLMGRGIYWYLPRPAFLLLILAAVDKPVENVENSLYFASEYPLMSTCCIRDKNANL